MILLDTTILSYAVGGEHPLRQPCRDVLDAIGTGLLAAATTVEVIQEFADVRARRRSRRDAVALATDMVELLRPLIRPDEQDVARGLELFATYERLGSFDAVLAAVAIRREHVTGLMSADRAFADVAGLDYVDPASFQV